jgi:hypothetical protein
MLTPNLPKKKIRQLETAQKTFTVLSAAHFRQLWKPQIPNGSKRFIYGGFWPLINIRRTFSAIFVPCCGFQQLIIRRT